MRTPAPNQTYDTPVRRYEAVASPPRDQGVVNSLGHAFEVEALPDDMKRTLARLR